jgi:hypothetical protein
MNPTVKPDAIELVRGMPKFNVITDVIELSFKILTVALANSVIYPSILSH